MPRITAASLPLAALLAGLALPTPAAAESDPAARQFIEQLMPRGDAVTRGIRLPASPAAPPAISQPQPAATIPASPAAMATPSPAPSVSPPTIQALPPPRPAALPSAVSTATTAPPNMAAVSITVIFASGSAMLTAQAEQSLAPLGRALASPDLAPFRFRIEGHTDTVGDAGLNQRLSERRAEAVRGYLMTTHSVPAARLEAVGLGESMLLVPTSDGMPEKRNRRVQVVNIGG